MGRKKKTELRDTFKELLSTSPDVTPERILSEPSSSFTSSLKNKHVLSIFTLAARTEKKVALYNHVTERVFTAAELNHHFWLIKKTHTSSKDKNKFLEEAFQVPGNKNPAPCIVSYSDSESESSACEDEDLGPDKQSKKLVKRISRLKREKQKLKDLLNKEKEQRVNDTTELNAEIESRRSWISFKNDKIASLAETVRSQKVQINRLSENNEINIAQLEELEEQELNPKIPEVKLRDSRKRINPLLIVCLAMLRYGMKIPHALCVPIVVAVGNTMFNQKWRLGNSQYKSKRSRDILPGLSKGYNKVPKQAHLSIDQNTAPGPSFTKSVEKTLHGPGASKRTFEEVKDSDRCTGLIDGLATKRKKGTAMAFMYKAKEVVRYSAISIMETGTMTAESTYEFIMDTIRQGAVITAVDIDAASIQESMKRILDPLKLWVTDAASTMEKAIKMVAEMKKQMGSFTLTVWLHCNAHICTSLDSGSVSVLKMMEDVLGVKERIVAAFNQQFYKVNASKIYTAMFSMMNLFGPSDLCQEYAMTKAFSLYLEHKGIRNHLLNARCSRFGKDMETAFLVLFHLDDMKDFLINRDENNGLFASCKLFITECPYLKEFLTAITLTYYHLLRPFLVATGCETAYGYKTLSHKDLCVFYAALIIQLKELSDDSSPLFSELPLSFIQDFPHLHEVSHQGYCSMFSKIFEDLSLDMEQKTIDMEICKAICSAFAEKYWAVFHKQISKTYLSETGIVQRLLAEDPTSFDGVPSGALAIEHTVGNTHHAAQRAPTALMESHGELEKVGQSVYLSEIVAEKDPIELDKTFTFLRRSPQIKLFRKLRNIQREKLHAHQFTRMEHQKKKLDDKAERRRKIIVKVSLHGGPCLTFEKLESILSPLLGAEKEAVFLAELQYQKTVVGDRSIDPNLYIQKKLSSDRKSMNPLPYEKRLANMKVILSATASATLTEECDVPREVITTKLLKIKDELKLFNQGRSLQDKFVAVYWDEGQQWFPGLILSQVPSSQCEECEGTDKRLSTKDSHCYDIQHLDLKENSDDRYEIKSSENQWHTLECQIIRYLTVDDEGNNTYRILDPVSDIITALGKNKFYKKVMKEKLKDLDLD